MSAGTQTLKVAPRFERAGPAASPARAGADGRFVRLAAFAALTLYGLVRWMALLHPAPTARLLGLWALAVVIVGVVPLLRRLHPAIAIVGAGALGLLAFPIAGLRWNYFIHERIALSAREIGRGLQSLSGVLVPYTGTSASIVLVVTLGAAVLVLDGAIVLAFAPSSPSGVRRASAALPVIALAIVPATLVRPQLPYVQGLLLFGLLALFLWGDRVRRDAVGAAVTIAALAGVVGAIAAPRLDLHRALVDYRAWAGTFTRRHPDAFDWNQTYGPLRWPKVGHTVLTVRARQGDYWKAENLSQFDGYTWKNEGVEISTNLPAPDRSARTRWTQPIRVSIRDMRTTDVIAAGYAAAPAISGGGVVPGTSPGTWIAQRTLGPGATYDVSTYSPSPSTAQLRAAGRAYPEAALTAYRTLAIPDPPAPASNFPTVLFAPFQSREPSIAAGGSPANVTRLLEDSPYAGAYALARRLAANARTPFGFVRSVERYLSHGFRYNEHPPVRQYPLESFLFKDKIGYCQQFSGTMTMLLRMGGLPAQVAAGFTSGSVDSASHQWTVSDIDAHAWVEVWFPHYGWVRFDPTPAVAPARSGQASAPFEKPLPGISPAALSAPRRDIGAIPTVTGPGHRAAGGASPLPVIEAAGLVGLAALAALGLGLGLRRRRRPMDEERLVSELERALARSGRPLEGGATLAGLEHRFRSSPAAAGYFRSLRLARYAGAARRPTASQRRALREQLSLGLGFTGRLRALWALPPRLAGRPGRHRTTAPDDAAGH